MDMAIRLIVSDIDATLLPNGGSISPRTRAAVRSCAQQGVTFAVATGRWYVTARRVVEALGQEDGYMIVANGGAILRLDGTPVKLWGMPRTDAETVYRLCRGYDLDLLAYTPRTVYCVNMKRPESGRERSRTTGAYRFLFGDVEGLERDGLSAPNKMAVDCEDARTLARLRAALEEAGLCVSSSHATNLEIMSKGMGKGAATTWLAGHLGVGREETLALGDNTNDLDMLSAAHWSVAMGDAVPELKAAARLIAPRDVEDGAAQIIERALRGELGR